jgi:hypothetical protein
LRRINDKPWFLTEGKWQLYSSYLPLGVPNWTVIYINTSATSKVTYDYNQRKSTGPSRTWKEVQAELIKINRHWIDIKERGEET